jgi:hypothetical protein
MGKLEDSLLSEADRRGSGDIVRAMLGNGSLVIVDLNTGDTSGNLPVKLEEDTGPRSISEIARDIKRSPWWRSNASIYARDYINAMSCINSIDDQYGLDSGESVVLYALSNMATFKGEEARAIKAELKSHLSKNKKRGRK